MKKEEFDSSKLAFEIYKKIYSNLLINIIDKKRTYVKEGINHNGKKLVDMDDGETCGDCHTRKIWCLSYLNRWKIDSGY